MCGIAGILGVEQEYAVRAAERMLAVLRHRGPDDSGVEVVQILDRQVPPSVLVHTRLATVELSSLGHQPMLDADPVSGDAPNRLTYNGEIYNYMNLWPELEEAGLLRRSDSDSEVILQAYRLWGEASVERLEGMFAFCLLDPHRQRAWLCRDRVGIKPLYLCELPGGGLVFASELRAILASGLSPRRLHSGAIESLLAQGAIMGEQSMVEGIFQLRPGESRMYDLRGKLQRARIYWKAPFDRDPDRTQSRSAYVEELHGTLKRAVDRTLQSDAPVGLFLSGGVDSATVATLAAEVSSRTLQGLTLGFDEPEFDESAAAVAVARELGMPHRVVRLSSSELVARIDDVLTAMDQPSVDGFNTYQVSRAARASGLTVVLSGLGGDELFGGYASFRDVPKALGLQRSVALLPALKSWVLWGGRLLGPRGRAKCQELLRRPRNFVQAYLLRRELFLPAERRALQTLPEGCDPHSGLSQSLLAEAAGAVPSSPLKAVSALEYSLYMRHMLLRDADVFSMACGVELRVPLLDHRVVESVAAAPGHWLRPDHRLKPLLVDAAGKGLPRRAWQEKKRGFAFPWREWLLGPLRERARAALCERAIWQRLGFDPHEPARLFQRFSEQEPGLPPLQIVALLVLSDYVQRHQLAAS